VLGGVDARTALCADPDLDVGREPLDADGRPVPMPASAALQPIGEVGQDLFDVGLGGLRPRDGGEETPLRRIDVQAGLPGHVPVRQKPEVRVVEVLQAYELLLVHRAPDGEGDGADRQVGGGEIGELSGGGEGDRRRIRPYELVPLAGELDEPFRVVPVSKHLCDALLDVGERGPPSLLQEDRDNERRVIG